MPAKLPDAVYRDVVATLFAMHMPIAGMGLLFLLAGLVIYAEQHDPVIAAVTALGVGVMTGRMALLFAFHRKKATAFTIAQLQYWERLYAVGSHAFAILLAALAVQVLRSHSPLNHLIAISLIFTFGAGVVSRIGSRPALCVTSLLLATVPTIVALALHSGVDHGHDLHSEYFIVEAILVTVVTALSLESVRHLYRSTVEHLTAKHDLAHMVRQDALTGLPNRLLLRERFQDSLKDMAADRRQLAVHFLDLDGFKAINDRCGHPAGDAVLREAATRLRSIVRSVDTVARFGGDEFIVVQAGVRHAEEAEMLARRIIKQLSQPYIVEEMPETPMKISVSIGIAMAPQDGLDLDHLTACADAALYRSKRSGKARLYFCTAEDIANASSAA